MAVTQPFITRQLGPDDAAGYRAVRLDGLQRHPAAFGAAWAEEAEQPLDWFAGRLRDNAVFGGWTKGPALAGGGGLMVPV